MYAKVQFQTIQGRIQDFKLEGAHLKNLSRAEGATKVFGVFRVKNHDFTPKNHIFSNFRRGARAGCAPWIRPCYPIHSCKGPTIYPAGVRLYDKNSESYYFFFLHQNQNILFSNIGNQNIFFRKNP
jgi:hypothetical protein